MQQYNPLMVTLAGGLILAFILGSLADRLKMPPLVGYLLAGVLLGPYASVFNADETLAHELAEVGVILLMFSVGLHLSLKELLAVKVIAIPGALLQILFATLLGIGFSYLLDWPMYQGFMFSFALSVASTVVMMKALQERRLLETKRAQIAVGWLIVEDIAMVLALVLIPPLSGLLKSSAESVPILKLAILVGITLLKIGAFMAVMLLLGRRFIPWLLEKTADTGSRELFRLAVTAIALGFALIATHFFGVSLALGAFFAGLILSDSELNQRAVEESIPLRDIFAVLFFVSVGMLFNPSIIWRDPMLVGGTLLIIVVGKFLAAYAIVRAFRYSRLTALTVGVCLAQIGEFSFILAGLGVNLRILSETQRDLILSGAILSIFLNPLLFMVLDRITDRMNRKRGEGKDENRVEGVATEDTLTGHVILIGFGRVGHLVTQFLRDQGQPFVVIEDQLELVQSLRERGIPVLFGNAAHPGMLHTARIAEARWLLIAIPNAIQAGQIIARAKKLNPGIEILARAHSSAQVQYLQKRGASHTIMGESEIAQGMVNWVLASKNRLGEI